MTKTLIDAGKLQDRLSKRLIETAEIVPKDQLSDVLKAVLAVRQQTRSMLVSSNIPINERDRLLTMLEGMSEKYFLVVAALEKDKLPLELAEILEIQQIVGEMIENQEMEVRPAPKSLPGRKHKKKAGSELLSLADHQFESIVEIEFYLTEILNDIRAGTLEIEKEKGPEAILNDEEWKNRLKFQPFIQLAQRTDMTPEEWMDCEAVRRYCAEWLSEQFKVNVTRAASFYAHVTPKFRDRPNSMWQAYKAQLEQSSDRQEEGQNATSEQSADPGAQG